MEMKGLVCWETTAMRDDVLTVALIELQDQELILGRQQKYSKAVQLLTSAKGVYVTFSKLFKNTGIT